tara:strand:- start:4207 stop:4308 length:102 start_codon:yes stop_codon:yes gene_type:complete
MSLEQIEQILIINQKKYFQLIEEMKNDTSKEKT